MVEREFAVPASPGDERDGRVTIMAAGGGVEANIERWCGQFTQPDGADTGDRAKVEKKTIAGHEVHLVDISGSYNESRGPFGPGVLRPDYRMLAAIISIGQVDYFVKFYGPRRTVADNEDAFQAMIGSLKADR